MSGCLCKHGLHANDLHIITLLAPRICYSHDHREQIMRECEHECEYECACPCVIMNVYVNVSVLVYLRF